MHGRVPEQNEQPRFHIRDATIEDAEKIREYILTLSQKTRELRYRSRAPGEIVAKERVDDLYRYPPDNLRHVELLLELADGKIGGVVHGYLETGGCYEVALSVTDGLQGQRIGGVLLSAIEERLRTIPGAQQIVLHTESHNHNMIKVALRHHFICDELHTGTGEVTLYLRLHPDTRPFHKAA